MTAPWPDSVASLIRETHAQVFRAEAVTAGAGTFPLDVLNYSVTWAEDTAPRVMARISTPASLTAAQLDALDPRAGARVRLTAGYVLADGTESAYQVALLWLRSRTLARPSNTLDLVLASSEAMYIDGSESTVARDTEPNVYAAGKDGGAVAALQDAIWYTSLYTPLADKAIVDPAIAGRDQVAYQGTAVGDTWSAATDAAASIDSDLFDNGDGVLRLAPRRYVPGPAVLSLTTGAAGTLTDTDATVDREEWFNQVNIVWEKEAASGAMTYVFGSAMVVDGPFASATAGVRRYTETRSGRPQQWQADAICRAMLRRFLANARQYQVDTVSAWWVRPSDTVTIQLPTGNQERHLVATVTHTTGGSMTLTTRQPDTASVIGE